jgi:PAS domain S-box-containing protein
VLPQSSSFEQSSPFAELLIEWVDDPLLLVEHGTVVAANDRACELCRAPREKLIGIPLGVAIDTLYKGIEALPESIAGSSDVEVHRLSVEGRNYQVAVMRLPAVLTTEESLYRRVFSRNFDAYWITTPDGRFLDFSDSYAAMVGCTPEQLRRMSIGDVDRDHAGWQISLRLASARRAGFDQFEVKHKVGATSRGEIQFLDLEIRLAYLPRGGGHVFGSVRDITEMRRARADVRRAEQTAAMVERCIALARTAADRQALLDGVCQAIVEDGRYAMAWVGVPDPSDAHRVRPEAAAGNHVEYLDEAVIAIEDTVLGANAEEAGAERLAVCNDFETADFAPWRELALRYGFAASLSLPLTSGSRVAAALNVYASQRDAFSEEHIRSLAQVVASTELGLEVVSRRVAQKAFEVNAADWDESFRAAFEQSFNGMVVYDLSGRVLDANAEFCSRLGYTRQELLSMHMSQIVPEERAAEFLTRLDTIGAEGFATFLTAYTTRNGDQHPMELSCRTYAYGETSIVLAIVRRSDQSEPSLNAPMHLAVQASRTGLFDWDLRSNKVIYSNEWKAQLGYSEHELGTDFGEWELRVHPDDAERMVRELKAAVAERSDSYESEYRMRRKDGTWRWVLTRGAVMRGPAGEAERMLGSQVDITERKRSEQQRSQAQKIEAVSRLAGGLSQDLNQSLAIINGYADLILPSLYEGDPLREKIESIREAGERATRLSGRLRGLLPLPSASARPVNVNLLLSEMEATLRRLLDPGVSLVTAYSPESPWIKADAGRMGQLLMNLVFNARDAMPGGGALRVAVGVEPHLPRHLVSSTSAIGRHVRLTVSDTGKGMDDETRLELFDPFRQRFTPGHDNPVLPAVHGIVQQHGGVIAVASELGKGTEFRMYFPAIEIPAGSTESGGAAGQQGFAGSTVLVMDADIPLRKLSAEILRGAGHTVVEAASFGDALLYAESHPNSIHLLVSELLDGPELAQRLAALEPGIKALFLTPAASDDPRTLAKPFTPAALSAAVQRALSVNGGAG